MGAALWWDSMYSINWWADWSESLINLVAHWYPFLQLTLTRLEPGWGGGCNQVYTGKWAIVAVKLTHSSSPVAYQSQCLTSL